MKRRRDKTSIFLGNEDATNHRIDRMKSLIEDLRSSAREEFRNASYTWHTYMHDERERQKWLADSTAAAVFWERFRAAARAFVKRDFIQREVIREQFLRDKK